MGRIVDYPEITTLSDGDYLIVDNAEGGTKKVSAQSVAGTVDPTPTESSTNAVSSGGVWTSLNDISEEFDGLRTDAYDVYPKGIASGDIVQFETGADNVPLSDLTGYIYPMMSGSGMPSRTNIRTISGPDDINIYQRNKNLIEQITYQAEPETVYLGVQNSSNLTMFFKAGDYRITVNIVGGSTVVPYWSVGSTATHSEYMHLDNDTNVSIYVYDADGISASDIESFQVEVGTEATDYVEFEGDITNVVLPTDRGTIYSGRVALTAGKVYIDAVIYERNSSTMNNTEDKPGWAYTGLQTYDVAIGTFDDVIYWPNGDVRCTNVNVGSTYSVEVANEDYSLILPRDVYNMSQSQWISAGVDIQILVKLNTPIEIDIDPVEVRSLYGFNTYYCNSGKTGVIFGMDLAKYISDKTTEVQKEEQAKLEKAFATDTASGAVATFTDGADDIPMKSVKVAIEPVQDLHGYDHPWPAGGGKNLFDPTKYRKFNPASSNIVELNGDTYTMTWVNAAIVFDTKELQTFPAGTYTSTFFGTNLEGLRFKVVRVSDNTTITTMPGTFTAEEEFYVGISGAAPTEGETHTATFTIQLEVGSTATDYAPYSNICPISGWTGAQVARTGKNLFDKTKVVEGVYIQDNNGVEHQSIGSVSTNYIPVKPNESYYIKSEQTKGTWGAWYDKDKNFISGITAYATTTAESAKVKTAPSNAYYMRLTVLYASNNEPSGNPDTFLVNYPSTDHDYHPYAGDTYSITFPSEAGTVYGGTLDVTNGVLTVDRAMVDLGTVFDWIAETDPLPGTARAAGDTSLFNIYVYNQYPICSALKGDMPKSYRQIEEGCICFSNTPSLPMIRVRSQTFVGLTNEEIKIALSGVQCCLKIKEPIVYTLTPTEIKSLLGDNNIWADAGDTSVTYRADTKLYIDKKIAEVINALS